MRTAGATTPRSLVADGLTAARIVLAVVMIPVADAGDWRLASVLLAVAWWTDFFDGRIARTTTGTRLGEWDPLADTAVGVGLIIGLANGGHVPALPWLLVGALLLALYLGTSRFAFSQLLQATAYGAMLWFAFHNDWPGLILLVATIGLIGVLDARRFATHNLPTFFEELRIRRS